MSSTCGSAFRSPQTGAEATVGRLSTEEQPRASLPQTSRREGVVAELGNRTSADLTQRITLTHAAQTDPPRRRTEFSSEQVSVLERSFTENQYPTWSKRTELAARLCVREKNIATWFQNRRTRGKRIYTKEERLLIERLSSENCLMWQILSRQFSSMELPTGFVPNATHSQAPEP